MKDYVTHILKDDNVLDSAHTKISWCGRRILRFHFLSVDHMLFNRVGGGRLISCKKCLNAVEKVMKDERGQN